MDAEMQAQAEAFVAQAVATPVAEKRPLFRAPPPAPDFPLMALGPLRRAIEAVHRSCPRAWCRSGG
jgi:hypothetical protein